MYLLDTDTLIYALKGDPCVTRHLDEKAAQPKALIVMNWLIGCRFFRNSYW